MPGSELFRSNSAPVHCPFFPFCIRSLLRMQSVLMARIPATPGHDVSNLETGMGMATEADAELLHKYDGEAFRFADH